MIDNITYSDRTKPDPKLSNIINGYLYCTGGKGVPILEQMRCLLLYDQVAKCILQKILSNDVDDTALSSTMMKNLIIHGYAYPAYTMIGKLFEYHKCNKHKSISLRYLIEDTRDFLSEDKEFKEIERLCDPRTNMLLKEALRIRNKVICHNDKFDFQNLSVELHECTKVAFKTFRYYCNLLSADIELNFYSLCNESWIDNEIKMLSLPILRDDNDKSRLKTDYINGLNDFGFNKLSWSDTERMMRKLISVQEISH